MKALLVIIAFGTYGPNVETQTIQSMSICEKVAHKIESAPTGLLQGPLQAGCLSLDDEASK